MPSERTDSIGLSASPLYRPEDMHFPDERQLRMWKTGPMSNYYGSKVDGMLQTSIDSSPLEKRMALDSQISMASELADSYHKQGLRNLIMEKHVAGVAGPASRSLPRALEHDLGARRNFNLEPSYFMEGNKLNLIGTQGENSLFSSSLSELFSRKLRLSSSNNLPYGHSVGATASQYEEEEPFESLEELEAQTIGNLLPDDDDLFSGVTDGIDYINPPNNIDDMEDLDVFSNIGGMDLGDDGLLSGQSSEFSGANSNGLLGASVGGEHPFGEHPSRTLFVRNINSNVEDSELRTLFGQYGEIRTLYTACKHRGFVMISYYDIRAARNAMKYLQNKPLRRRKLDIHFSIPKDNPSDKDVNQGTLVIFNLDSSVTNEDLHQIFGVCGEIKEIRETPHRSHHKFIEFYDIRAAEAALQALNRSDIAGKRIKLEPSRPGGARRLMQPFSSELDVDESSIFLQQASPPSSVTTGFSAGTFSHSAVTSGIDNDTIYATRSASGTTVTPLLDSGFRHAISFSVPSSVPSPTRVGSVGNQSNISESPSQGEMKFEFHTAALHPHSLPDYHDRIGNGISRTPPSAMSSSMNGGRASEVMENHKLNEVFAASNGSCPSPGRHYMWSNTQHPQPQGMIWPNSPSYVNGVRTGHPQQLHMVPRPSNQLLSGLLPISNHQVGSAPSVNPSLWDGRHGYGGESPDSSVFHPGSLGSMRISGGSPHPLEYVPRNIFPGAGGGNCMDLQVPSKSVGFNSHPQRCMMFPARGQMIPMMNSFDSPTERSRSRRNESSSSQADNKKQFDLDIDRIVRGDDKRTTLMIKNIPNKYTSKMLLAAIDERHRGTYDFIYLPIDFKNKCNVGYAFINMTDPSLIIPFYQAFNGKKWEKFNSEKVASLAYARIQGKSALIAHFQNSSLMNEDKRCRPILFHTDGPNAGDQVPFPMGVNVRSRPGKNRTNNLEENMQEGSQNLLLLNGEVSCCSGDETMNTGSSMKESSD